MGGDTQKRAIKLKRTLYGKFKKYLDVRYLVFSLGGHFVPRVCKNVAKKAIENIRSRISICKRLLHAREGSNHPYFSCKNTSCGVFTQPLPKPVVRITVVFLDIS